MNQDLTDGKWVEIDQMYIKLENKDGHGSVLYSFPPVLDDNIRDDSVLSKNIDGIYRKCREKREVVVDY